MPCSKSRTALSMCLITECRLQMVNVKEEEDKVEVSATVPDCYDNLSTSTSAGTVSDNCSGPPIFVVSGVQLITVTLHPKRAVHASSWFTRNVA